MSWLGRLSDQTPHSHASFRLFRKRLTSHARSSPSGSLAQSNRRPPPDSPANSVPEIVMILILDCMARRRWAISTPGIRGVSLSSAARSTLQFLPSFNPSARLLPTKTSQPACSRIHFSGWSTRQSSLHTQQSETDRCLSVVLVSHGSTNAAVSLLQSNVPDRRAQRNEPSHEFGITT